MIDQGGAYRNVLTDAFEELKGSLDYLKRVENVETATNCYIVNEKQHDDDERVFNFIGGLMAFSFLTRQPFGIDLANLVWKQVMGSEIEMEDVRQFDPATYCEIDKEYPLEVDGEDRDASREARKRAIERKFAKFQKKCGYIREGMNIVLDNKIDVVAYLPLEDIRTRVCGRATFEVDDLKKITKLSWNYSIDEAEAEARKVFEWFWQILEGYSQEMRAKYLKFVWGRDRLPAKFKGEQHLFYVYEPKEETARGGRKTLRWQRNSLPKSHTCTFQFECPFFDSKAIFAQRLQYVVLNALSVED